MRSASERQADALLRLERDANVWIATSSPDGQPHLVPLSLAWDGNHMLVATPSVTPTARNAAATGKCKASLDSAVDVVLIDADVEVVDFASADPETAARYVKRVGWNPADEPGEWSLLILEPRTVRAWSCVSMKSPAERSCVTADGPTGRPAHSWRAGNVPPTAG